MAADDHAPFDQEQYELLLECGRSKNITPWNVYRTEQAFMRIQLQGTSLEEAYLVEADLRDADIRDANLKGANLVGAKLGGAKLAGANLTGADLAVADLNGADLEGANLGRANLEGADLEGTKLEGANLEGAKLGGTKLEGSNNEGADLEVADFGEDILEGADRERAKEARRARSQKANGPRKSSRRKQPDRSMNDAELVIDLAEEISYEEITDLLTSIRGLSLSLAGTAPVLNEIQVGEQADEYATAWLSTGGNRISLSLAKNMAETLSAAFAETDAGKTEAAMNKAQGFDFMLEFMEKAGVSENERKAIVADQITSADRTGNILENLQIISDLAERRQINFQTTAPVGASDGD